MDSTLIRPLNGARQQGIKGVALGAGAGSLWGFIFLGPELVSDFPTLYLTIGRYLCCGVLAALLLAPRFRSVMTRLVAKDWLALGWLALTGNVLFYICLTHAVRFGGIAMTSLVIGLLPVFVTLVGSRDRASVPLGRLVPTILLCVAGVACIAWQALDTAGEPAGLHPVAGLSCAGGALASWTAYAVFNARRMCSQQRFTPGEWSLLVALTTGLLSLILLPIGVALPSSPHAPSDWLRLVAVAAALALGASIIGNALWNRMSQLLPLTMVGQMILFETLFGLLYGLIWAGRWPTALEAAALTLVIASVVTCVSAHRPR